MRYSDDVRPIAASYPIGPASGVGFLTIASDALLLYRARVASCVKAMPLFRNMVEEIGDRIGCPPAA